MHLFFNSAILFLRIYSKGTFKLQRCHYSRHEAKAGMSEHPHRENGLIEHRSNVSKLATLPPLPSPPPSSPPLLDNWLTLGNPLGNQTLRESSNFGRG